MASWSKAKNWLEWAQLAKFAGDLLITAASWKAIKAVLAHVPHISQEWASSIALFSAGIILWLIVWWQQKRRTKQSEQSGEQSADRIAGTKLVIHRAVYAAGLPTEVSVTDKLQNAARDALVITVDSTLGGLLPTDPAFNVPKRLDVDYSYGSDTRFPVSRQERPPGEIMRLVLPEDTEVLRLTNELAGIKVEEYRCRQIRDGALAELRAANTRIVELENEIERMKHQPFQTIPGGSLAQRAFSVATQIRSIQTKHGKRPTLSQAAGEDVAHYLKRCFQATQPWDDLIAAEWREIQREVLQIRADLGKKDLRDEEFDGNLTADRPSEEQLNLLVDKLRLLGFKAFDLSG